MAGGNKSGVRMTDADGADIGPGDTLDFIAGGAGPGSLVLVETVDPVTTGVEVWAHPLSPEGTYFPFETSNVAIATGVIAAGQRGTVVELDAAPANVFGISLKNNDGITHSVGLVVYGNGER